MNRLEMKPPEFDSYEIEEPSDEELSCSSSEDELDVLLNGTVEQKKKLIREYLTGESESSSGDDFEKEMEAELSSTIRTMEGTWGSPATGGNVGANSLLPNPRMYDEVYFDSDSEEEDKPGSSTGRRQKQRIIKSNDELLYDPDEDDRDQAWVDARRRRYTGRNRAAVSGSKPHPQQAPALPSSDAILNCPACMTTLCLDCQRLGAMRYCPLLDDPTHHMCDSKFRHEKYRTQYRAMFVMNCTVKADEVLRYQTQPERKQRNRKRRKVETTPDQAAGPTPAGMDADELYHPVCCSECSTEVAVFDKDEVYHFFNVLSSHC